MIGGKARVLFFVSFLDTWNLSCPLDIHWKMSRQFKM